MLKEYTDNPQDPVANYNLAEVYYGIKQYASALSFYLRAAERFSDNDLIYTCLMRAANCYYVQGSRNFTVRGLLQQAISIIPNKSDAYYLLADICAETNYWEGHWFDAYTNYCLADFFNNNSIDSQRLKLKQAVAAWNCGKPDETAYILYNLVGSVYEKEALNLASSFGITLPSFSTYNSTLIPKFGVTYVSENYSEAYQDLVALNLLKNYKTYLEIGSGSPFYGSNSYLLEKNSWQGVSIDIDPLLIEEHYKHRKHTAICRDARLVDYAPLLASTLGNKIGYLQIDCDPAEISLNILQTIPFDKLTFGFITFEHDFYANQNVSIKQSARQLLENYGYQLFIENVGVTASKPYEDWYINPSMVDETLVKELQQIGSSVVVAQKALFK